jgi:predicted flavoprotein YhiN
MQPSQPNETEILQQVLAPLLEDFQYWFNRSSSLLESETMPFLSSDEQADLLARIKKAQAEVKAATTLFHATGGRAGVETKVLIPWHRLVAECWNIARKWRESKQEDS